MQSSKAFEQVEHKFEHAIKKRFACSHCGKTWVEIIGSFSRRIDGGEDIYFQIGQESEACQNCKFRIKSCPSCGSNDAYEINFPSDTPDSLSFDHIRIVSNT
jgi:transposase-like protein